jgi:hypothetical protein
MYENYDYSAQNYDNRQPPQSLGFQQDCFRRGYRQGYRQGFRDGRRTCQFYGGPAYPQTGSFDENQDFYQF